MSYEINWNKTRKLQVWRLWIRCKQSFFDGEFHRVIAGCGQDLDSFETWGESQFENSRSNHEMGRTQRSCRNVRQHSSQYQFLLLIHFPFESDLLFISCHSIRSGFRLQVWFNNKGWASSVSYLNAVNNLILRTSLSERPDRDQFGITAINHPMNYTQNQLQDKIV